MRHNLNRQILIMLCWCKVSSAVVEVDQIRLKSMSNMDVNAKHQLARDAVILMHQSLI